jgi:hypothetical protein
MSEAHLAVIGVVGPGYQREKGATAISAAEGRGSLVFSQDVSTLVP